MCITNTKVASLASRQYSFQAKRTWYSESLSKKREEGLNPTFHWVSSLQNFLLPSHSSGVWPKRLSSSASITFIEIISISRNYEMTMRRTKIDMEIINALKEFDQKREMLKWPIWPEVFVDQNCYCQSCWHFLIWFCTLYTFISKHITPTYNKSFKAVESFSQEKNLRASKLLSHKSFPFPSRKKE